MAIAPSGDTTQGAQNQLIDKWKALTKNAKSFEKVKASSQEKNKLSALIGLPASGNVTVTVLDGASATIIDLVLRSPIQETIVKDANNHHGFVWEGTGFPSGTTLDFGIWWYGYYGMSGWEYSCDISQVDDSTYILGFEDTGAPPINVDLIVQVVLGGIPISPPVDHFDVTLLPDTIHQLDVSTVRVRARDALNNDIFLQPNTQLKITADDGGTYGHVGENGVPGEVFSYRDAYSGTVGYNADGDVPDNVQKVMIHVEKADDPGKNGTGNLYIAPLDHFEVHPRTDTIHHAEQTAIFVQAKDANNQDLQYYGGNVQISASPSGYGHLTYVIPSAIVGPKDKIGKPISLSVTSGKGKASSSLESVKPTGSNSLAADDPPLVVDYWTASHGLVFYTADGAAPVGNITITLTVSAVDKPSVTGTGNLLLTRKNFDILLGETQYFYAVKDPDHSDRLTIKEFSTPKNGNTNVLFEDPQVVEGDKLGVYWEYKDADGNDLTNTTPGCIRLIGRYWKPDQKYSVRLIAKLANGSRADTIVVEVKKPSALGKQYRRARDVYDREISIDDSCIVYGGRYGIPPQFLKAQIGVESPTRTFLFSDGKHERGFAPAYRFEPFTEQFALQSEKWQRNAFYVLPSSLRDPPPPDHKYVLSMNYIKDMPVTVWYFVRNYSQLVDGSKSNLYGKRNSDGTMDFASPGYTTVQAYFDTIFVYFRNPKGGSLRLSQILSVSEAADSARTVLTHFLKTEWNGGLDNIIAQTRIASSYGYFQAMYRTATGKNYAKDDQHLPEDLNIPEINFPLAVKYQAFLLEVKLGNEVFSGGNWPNGFEDPFKNFVYYPKWNSRKSYPDDVFGEVKNYLPKK